MFATYDMRTDNRTLRTLATAKSGQTCGHSLWHQEDMSTSAPAARLKAIRNSVKLSIREMAEILGMPKSAYEHYEARFKKPYLPAEFAASVADALEGYGVPRGDILSLATPPDDEPSQDDINFAGRYRLLSPHRQRMLRDLLTELEAAERVAQPTPQGPSDSSN